jgi:hypothetical protein
MADLHAVIGVVAGGLGLLGFVPYGIAVLRRVTQPSIASWVIWTALGWVISAAYFTTGSGNSWWLTGSYAVGPLVILLLSLRVGHFAWARLDSLFIAGALVGLVWWWMSGVAFWGQAVSIAVDVCGAVPTLRKSWTQPGSEDPLAWWVFFVASLLNLFAVDTWSLDAGLYPIYSCSIAGVMLLCISRSRYVKLASA